MTAEDALQAEPAPLERSVAADGFERVLRARRRETTLREHQMRERHLVCANHAHDALPISTSHAHVTRLTTLLSSARSAAKEAAYAMRFARTTRSIAGSDASASRLRISRTRRRKRLRATSLNWKRGTMTPVRAWPRDRKSTR